MFNLFMWYIMIGLVFEIVMTIVDPKSYCTTDDEIRETIDEVCNKYSINRGTYFDTDGSIAIFARIAFNIGFYGGGIVIWPYMLYLELDILRTRMKIKRLEKELENLKKGGENDES